MIVDYMLISTNPNDPMIGRLHDEIRKYTFWDKCLIVEDEKYGDCLTVTIDTKKTPIEVLRDGVQAFMDSNKYILCLLETVITIDRNDDCMRDTYSLINAAFEWKDIPVIGIRVPPNMRTVTIFWKHTVCPETFSRLIATYGDE